MKNDKQMSILIAVPCFGGMIDANTAGSIYATGIYLKDAGIKTGLYFIKNESYIPSARNRIAYEFTHSEFSHLLCIDADIGFKPEDVMELIKANEGFVAASYPTKSENRRDTAFFSTDGEVGSLGLGFCLLKKEVFQELEKVTEILLSPSSWGSVRYHNFYGPMMERDYILTEDLSFCKRWRGIGGKIHLIKDIQLVHYGKFGYTFENR